MQYKCIMICLLGVINISYAECKSNIVQTAPNSRYQLLNNGSEVKDLRTNLIWQRCSEGQVWDGANCMGSANQYTWTSAMQRAANKGMGWRVPNIKELASLIERACTAPALNSTYFPNFPSIPTNAVSSIEYWSSSTQSTHAWIMSLDGGNTFGGNKELYKYVRFVRFSNQ